MINLTLPQELVCLKNACLAMMIMWVSYEKVFLSFQEDKVDLKIQERTGKT